MEPEARPEHLDNLTNKSKLTKKDIEEIAHRINKEAAQEMNKR